MTLARICAISRRHATLNTCVRCKLPRAAGSRRHLSTALACKRPRPHLFWTFVLDWVDNCLTISDLHLLCVCYNFFSMCFQFLLHFLFVFFRIWYIMPCGGCECCAVSSNFFSFVLHFFRSVGRHDATISFPCLLHLLSISFH